MLFRAPLLAGVLSGVALLLVGCKTTPDKADSASPAAVKKTEPTTLPDQSGDLAFQSFVSRLRMAVANRDIPTVASMMTPNFGYRLDVPDGEGAGVFEYWNTNNVWPELELVLGEKFVPSGKSYMVAPKEFVTNGSDYTGYRAGIQLVNGSWKFAYFVSGQG